MKNTQPLRTTNYVLRSERGFTLIEMLVVIGVIVVVAGVVLANNTRFGGTVLLENFAYDVALQVRQSQVYGISVVRFGTNNFTAPYGVHFDTALNTQYLFFADAVNGNGFYDSGELVKTTTLTRGFKINRVCVTPLTGPEDCTITKLDVIYKRPEPDAYIRANSLAPTYGMGRVQLVSPRGDTMSVNIYNNGQISVSRP